MNPIPVTLYNRPVSDVLHVCDGVIDASFLGAQDETVEVSVDHRRPQTLELCHEPRDSNVWTNLFNSFKMYFWKFESLHYIQPTFERPWTPNITVKRNKSFVKVKVLWATLTVRKSSSSCWEECDAVPGHTGVNWEISASGKNASPDYRHRRCDTAWSLEPTRQPCSSESCTRTENSRTKSFQRSWCAFYDIFDICIPECVGAQGSLVVACHRVRPLIPWHHFLQWRVLNDIEADAHAGSALHVVHMLGL